MPRVPTYDNFQAAPTVTPDVGVQAYSGPNAQQLGGQQMQELGGAAQRAGDSAAHIALAMQEQVNQTRVNDAVNKARQAAQDLAYNPQTGYLNLKGDAALTRPDGQALPDEYGSKLQTKLGEIASTLGNDMQRRQFQMNASDLQAQFHGQVESHMLGEFREHALSVQDGTINLASDDAKRNWSNPDLIAPSLNAAKAAVVEKGRVSGWSAAQTDAALLTTTSKVHTDVVLAALENNNPNYALGYLNARKGEMTPTTSCACRATSTRTCGWAGAWAPCSRPRAR
jgi:soluble lytic murein transglycosylase